MPKKSEQYIDRIKGILDKASRDTSLTMREYVEICEEIAIEAGDRSDTAINYIVEEVIKDES